MKKRWLVIELPDPITVDDIEAMEDDTPEDLADRTGYVRGYNAALEAVEHRLGGSA